MPYVVTREFLLPLHRMYVLECFSMFNWYVPVVLTSSVIGMNEKFTKYLSN